MLDFDIMNSILYMAYYFLNFIDNIKKVYGLNGFAFYMPERILLGRRPLLILGSQGKKSMSLSP
jgi:hypothetical protein